MVLILDNFLDLCETNRLLKYSIESSPSRYLETSISFEPDSWSLDARVRRTLRSMSYRLFSQPRRLQVRYQLLHLCVALMIIDTFEELRTSPVTAIDGQAAACMYAWEYKSLSVQSR